MITSFGNLVLAALLALYAVCGFANPINSDTIDEFVRTPAGLIAKSNIHAVPDGARIHHTPTQVQLIGADGVIIHSAPISEENPGTIHLASATATSTAPRTVNSGYVAYSYWLNQGSKPVTSFTTSWTVPPLPASSEGQLLYLFNGLIPQSFDGILQPVLQYGISPAGGGNYWAIASWYVIGSSAFHSTLVKVQPGQALTGVMTLTKTAGSGASTTYSWNSIFTGYPTTTISMSTTELLNWAYEALEIYTTSTAAGLPKGKTLLTNIQIATGGQPQPITWTAVSDSADNIQMAVVSSSLTVGALQITYPTQ